MIYLATKALALLAMGFVLWLPGWVIERRWSLAPRVSAEGDRHSVFLARWCLGLATWIASLFMLAAVGAFRLVPMATLAMLWLAAALWTHRSTGSSLVASPTPPSMSIAPGMLLLGGAGSVIFLLPLFAIAIDPTVSWDAQAYHLTLPQLYLEHGGFRALPFNVYSHWPHGVELLFGAAMAVDDYMLAKALHFGFGLLCLITLWRLAAERSEPGPLEPGYRSGSDIVGFVAACFFALNSVVLFELRVAYVDLAHAFFLLASAVFVARAYGRREDDSEASRQTRHRAFLLSGVAAGLLASVKVTGIVSSALLALMLAPVVVRTARATGRMAALRLSAAFAVPLAVLWLPWLAKAYLDTGNPIYPLLWSVFGGDAWSAELGDQFRAWQTGIGMGRSPLDYALLPLRVVLHGGRGYDHFDGEIGRFWLFAAPLALLSAWRVGASSDGSGQRLGERIAVGLAVLYFVAWALTSQQIRFLIPMLALLAWPAARTLGRLARGVLNPSAPRHRSLMMWATRLVVVATSVAILLGAHGKVVASGWQHLRIYATPNFNAQANPPAPPVFRAVAKLSPGTLILMLNTNQGFFSPRDYLADSFFEASQITDWLASAQTPKDVEQRLSDRNVTHVLLELRSRGTTYPPALEALLRDASLVRPLYRDDRHILFELQRLEP